MFYILLYTTYLYIKSLPIYISFLPYVMDSYTKSIYSPHGLQTDESKDNERP